MRPSKREQMLRERDRIAPLLERAFLLDENELRAMEEAAAKGKGGAVREFFESSVDMQGVPNPLIPLTDFDRANPHYHILRVLRNPNYFPLTCKLLLNIELESFQHAILKALWTKPMPLIVAARGTGKTFLVSLYCLLRALFHQGCQIAIVGSAFRQSKFVFDYMEGLWTNAPILRDLVGTAKGKNGRENGPRRDVDRCEFVVGQSKASALPIGPDGSKIRGERANYVIGEEFGSLSDEVFNNVVFGFASVSSNPVRQAREHRKVRVLKTLGMWDDEDERAKIAATKHNQVVVSGTADYAFGHFAKTYNLYRSIIYSKGREDKLQEIFPGGIPPNFDYRDYACIRLPVDLLPPRYMDEKIIGAARAKLSLSQYMREYGATFPTDSDGFIKRSLIEACVVGQANNPITIDDQPIIFYPSMRGEPGVQHVIAVDPASERDKLAVVVLAMCGRHRRIVHVWTTDRKSHIARKELQATVEGDYYRFCVNKIRLLMKRFSTARLAIDAQGGGVALEEGLANPTDGETPIYRLKDPPGTANRKPTDHKDGLHILEVVQFAKAQYVADANHNLKADFEQRVLLFPHWDTASEELALEDDKTAGRIRIEKNREVQTDDTLLDVVCDIEELKDELASIVHTQTPGGRERWDVPEVKLEGGKKGRQRKDRYSALLMANASARLLMLAEPEHHYQSVGTFRGKGGSKDEQFYSKKPGWIKEVPVFGSVKRHS